MCLVLCPGNRSEQKLTISVESVLALPGHSFCHTPLPSMISSLKITESNEMLWKGLLVPEGLHVSASHSALFPAFHGD